MNKKITDDLVNDQDTKLIFRFTKNNMAVVKSSGIEGYFRVSCIENDTVVEAYTTDKTLEEIEISFNEIKCKVYGI